MPRSKTRRQRLERHPGVQSAGSISARSMHWKRCPERLRNCRPRSRGSSATLTIPTCSRRIARSSTKPLIYLQKRRGNCTRQRTNGWSLKCCVKRSNRPSAYILSAVIDEILPTGVDLMTTPLAAKIARDYGTPAAVIDMDRVERNIARIQAACDTAGVANRPHIKTHKSPMLARMQIAAGAKGITCQKIGQAAVTAAAGIAD